MTRGCSYCWAGFIWTWPVIGRYAAESLFARAARLDRTNPEPHYYTAEAGIRLGGEDGEEFIHRGLTDALALNPDYRDAWALWVRIYRNDDRRRDMVAALARHAGTSSADYRRGQLLAELGLDSDAAVVLDSVVRRRPGDPGPPAWYARALFALGRDSAGTLAYEAALRDAARDSGHVLWRQVRGIATPEERAAFENVMPEDYPGFFRLFWSRRTPDLAATVNGRFAEHFHRLARAIHEFALLHPNSRYFRSAQYRALAGGVGVAPGVTGPAYENAAQTQCGGRRSGIRDAIVQAGFAPPFDTSAADPPNLDDNIDDRGLIYLRHGPPDFRSIGPHGESETWCYLEPDGRTLRVSFLRRTAGYGGTGDFVLTAMVSGEVEAARELLTTDRAAAKRDLAFSFSLATFRAADGKRTELVLITDSVQGLAALLDRDGREADRQPGSGGPIRLFAPPGPYILMFDASLDGRENHHRGPAVLQDYTGRTPVVSSILIAGGATLPVLNSMIAASTPKHELAATRPVRVYAEVYNLAPRDGGSRYAATYSFERIDGFIIRARRQREVTISFQREVPYAPRLIETLVIDPGRLPAGRYRLRIDVTDDPRGDAATTSIDFRLR